jgi:hypothetical protein
MSDSITTQLGAYAGYISLALAIAGMVVGAVNHRRIRSTCCRREASFSIDIDSTTPPLAPKTPPAQKPTLQ